MKNEAKNELLEILSMLLISVITLAILVFGGIHFGSINTENYELTETIELEPFKDSENNREHFLITKSDSEDENYYYKFINQNEEHCGIESLKEECESIDNIPKDVTTIYELEKGETPYIEVFESPSKFSLYTYYKYSVYIPKDSIKVDE